MISADRFLRNLVVSKTWCNWCCVSHFLLFCRLYNTLVITKFFFSFLILPPYQPVTNLMDPFHRSGAKSRPWSLWISVRTQWFFKVQSQSFRVFYTQIFFFRWKICWKNNLNTRTKWSDRVHAYIVEWADKFEFSLYLYVFLLMTL